ncbi:hypothetical protein EGW08_015350, partial [Elysia chlorotica]
MVNTSQFLSDDIWTSVDKAYIDISVGTALLSIIGCVTIISLFFAFKELRTTSRQLLVYLSVADIVLGLASVVQARGYVLSLGVSRLSLARWFVNNTMGCFFSIY